MGHLGAGLTARATGVIVAGGGATRLGGVPKGLLDVGGMRIIDRVAAALAPVTTGIVIAASAADASTWLPGVRALPDVLAGGGAAAGIHAALRGSSLPVVVVGWDMPFVTSAILRELLAAAGTGEFDAVVPSGTAPDRLEPLCAWYSHRVADAIESRWENDGRGLHDLLRTVRTYILPGDIVATTGAPERLFFNVNTPADLTVARAMAEGA